MFTRHELRVESTYGYWLMPVVPPMVSAATGAALIAHVPAGQLRLDLLVACYAMFGLSLLASLITITLLWARLAARVREIHAKQLPNLLGDRREHPLRRYVVNVQTRSWRADSAAGVPGGAATMNAWS
jgi:hypothetical protein